MSNPAESAHLEELLGHSEWLKRLALQLVPDVARAEDLVQETWVAVLRNPPDRERPARPWLATVLRRLAHRSARGEGRARWREEAAARPEALPSTEEILAQVETERRLASEVMRLEEPYREAVLLRYHQGLTAVEAARRLDVPASTVRGRVQEGLSRLRLRLDEAYPDRRAWCLALTRLLPPESGAVAAAVPPASIAGGVAVTATLKSLAAVCSVLVIAWLASESLSGPAKPSDEPALPSAPVAVDSARGTVPATGTDLDEVVMQPPSEPAKEGVVAVRSPVGSRATQSILTIRVRDDHGERVGNATVLLLDRADQTAYAAEGRTSAESGELALALKFGDYDLYINNGGERAEDFESHAERVTLSAATTKLVEVELRRRDATLDVVVTDEAGVPVAGIEVSIDNYRTVASTGVTGAASFEHLAPGWLAVRIRPGSEAPETLAVREHRHENVELHANQRSLCQFHLAKTGSLETRLEPVPGEVMEAEQVRLSLDYESGDYSCRAPGRGVAIGETYRFEHLPPGTYRVRYEVPPTSPFHVIADAPRPQVSSGEVASYVALAKKGGEVLSGRVVGFDGSPVAKVPLHLMARRADGQWDPYNNRTATSGADGRFEFRGLAPTDRRLYVDSHLVSGPVSYAYYGSFEHLYVEVPFPVSRPLKVQLERGYSVRGYVARHGVPLWTAEVALDRERFDSESRKSLKKDAEGRYGYFEFSHLRAGRYKLTVRRDEKTVASREIVLGDSSSESLLLEWELP